MSEPDCVDMHSVWHLFLEVLITGDAYTAEHMLAASSLLVDAVAAKHRGDTEAVLTYAEAITNELSELG